VVVVTHDERLAAQASRVIHMLDGRIQLEAAGDATGPAPRRSAAPL
jgi:ABC-type lipoprotein export system ATPase subunit